MIAALPALVLLDRLPVPILAVSHHGIIIVANPAFSAFVGSQGQDLTGRSFTELFRHLAAGGSAVAIFRDHAGTTAQLAHTEGWTVRAKMSTSVLHRHNDPVALVAFDDLTERLWDSHH